MDNYREKYKKYYGIEFDSSYVIHHIDEDRNNNDISNLLLLPRNLHSLYHTAKAEYIRDCNEILDTSLTPRGMAQRSVCIYSLNKFIDIIKETEKWINTKFQADIGCYKPYSNFENITYRGE